MLIRTLAPQILNQYDFSHSKFISVKKAETLYKMLLLKRIDGYIIGEKVGEYLQKEVRLNSFIFKNFELPTFLVFKKNVIDIDKVNTVLSTLKDSE